MTAISYQQVSKAFVNHQQGSVVQALSNISLDIAENEFVCLLGPSGCGKSTLLNLLAGFLKPDTGTIDFFGQPISGPSPDRCVVFQEATLFPWFTAAKNIDLGLEAQKLPTAERQQIVEQILALVGLPGKGQHYPHELSGGMRQRVALARVLALGPRALLMDEPFSALDSNTRERLQDELLRIWSMDKKTVLFVTHNVEEAVYLADRIVVIGPAPQSIRAEIVVDEVRPRSRTDESIRRTAEQLRQLLMDLPCCLTPALHQKGQNDEH